MSRFVLNAQIQLQAPTNTAQVVRQIQRQLGNVNIRVNVTGQAQVQRQLNQTNTAVQNLNNNANALGRSFAVVVRRFAAFSIATRAVTLLSNKLSTAVDEAIKFEREINKIAQVTGKSVKSLQGLTAEITRLSVTLGVSSQELANVGRILSQAGFKANDLTFALKALAKTDLAPTFENIQKTTEGAIAVFNQFGQGAQALEGQLGAINAVAGKFAVESSDLIGAVSRVGGVFSSAGGSLNELIALFTSVRSTTRESAESIATGLRTILTRIQRPTTIKFLEELGVSLTDLNGKFIGPFQAVQALGKEFSRLEQGDLKFVQIAEELGGFRQIGKVIPLIQQSEVALEAYNVAKKGSNSLDKDVETAQKSLAVQIAQLREEWIALVRSFAETGTFRTLVKSSLELASSLAKVLESLKPLLPILAGGLLGRGAIAGAGGLRRVFGFNRGGMVPGSGNGDTVPAMLTPGEFVISKDSVNQIGAGTLAAMNENKFAAGGLVHGDRGHYGSLDKDGRSLVGKTKGLTLTEAISGGFKRSQLSSAFGKTAVDSALGVTAAQAQRGSSSKNKKNQITGGSYSGLFGVSFLEGNRTDISSTIRNVLRESGDIGKAKLEEALISSINRKNPNDKISDPRQIKSYIARGAKLKTRGVATFLQPEGREIFQDDIVGGLTGLFSKATSKFRGTEFDPKAAGIPIDKLVSKSALGSIKGNFFEAFVRRITKNAIQDSSKDGIFDFNKGSLSGAKGDIRKLFGRADFKFPNEFKVSDSDASISNSIGKAISSSSVKGAFRFLNSGGGISGQDTVPAMLTPGEFVINRESAQRIGRGNLEMMNRHGVTGFNGGGSVGGGAGGAGNIGRGFGLILLLQSLPAVLSDWTTTLDESGDKVSTISSRVFDGLSGLLTPIAAVVAGLQIMGVELSRNRLSTLNQAFNPLSGGKAATSGRISGFFRQFQNAGTRVSQGSGRGAFGRAGFGVRVNNPGIGGRVARFAGGLAGRSAGALGAAGSIAAPIAGTALAFAAISKSISGFIGAQQEYEKAIKKGNEAEAQKYAVLKEVPGIIQLFGDTAAVATLDFLHAFGGESADLVKSRATAAFAAAKADRDKEKNALAASKALDEFKKGAVDAKDVLSAFSKNALNNIEVQKANRQTINDLEQNKSGTGSFTARNIFTLGGLVGESSAEKNARISKEQDALKKDNKDRQTDIFKSSTQAISGIARNIPLDKSFQDVIGASDGFAKSLQGLTDEQRQSLESIFNAEKKIRRANLEFLKSLNFGLQDVNGALDAAGVSFTNFRERQKGTATAFSQGSRILGASLTSAARFIDDGDFSRSIQAFKDNITQFGGSQEQANTAASSIEAFRAVQQELPNALARLQQNPDFTSGGPLDDDAFIREIGKELTSTLGAGNPELKRVIGSFSSVTVDDQLREKIAGIFADGGDISDISENLLKPLRKSVEDKLLPLMDKRAKLEAEYNSVIRKFTEERRALDERYVQAQQKSIDLLLFTAKKGVEFGLRGRVTSQERLSRRIDQFNIAAENSGVSGLTSGSASDIGRVAKELLEAADVRNRSRINDTRNGVNRQSNDPLRELRTTSQELVKFSKQRLDILKDELDIAKKKNAVEKSSFESLLTGDIEGFFKGFERQSAANILRQGGSLRGFSGDAILGAVNDNQGPGGLTPQQIEDRLISSGAFFSTGLGRSAAASISDSTHEQDRIRGQADSLLNVINSLGGLAESFNRFDFSAIGAEMQATTKAFENAMGIASNQIAEAFTKLEPSVEGLKEIAQKGFQFTGQHELSIKVVGGVNGMNDDAAIAVVMHGINKSFEKGQLNQQGKMEVTLTKEDFKVT